MVQPRKKYIEEGVRGERGDMERRTGEGRVVE